ncbi:MAG: NADH:flavin oxidoreductase/NADH oxidase family protein [Bacteroidota bacterium]
MLNRPFQLPCGATLSNRLIKSAMTERLSGVDYLPNRQHLKLYRSWAKAGAGLMISGNILVDRQHLESAGNIVVNENSDLSIVREWVQVARAEGQHFWAQINHAGRQTTRLVNGQPLSASAVQLRKMGLFARPKAMSTTQIEEVIECFVNTARLCKASGFTGVQIHAAHGYLLNQFLSPITNRRTDDWGGSLENRARLLLRIVRETRKVLGDDFPLSVKLNSADFQRGGFGESEALTVIRWLDAEKIDLLEISGGTYKRLVFFTLNSAKQKTSTREREAYFLDFAQKVRAESDMPLAVTGGFRSRAFVDQVLQNGELDFIGMARPFLTAPQKVADFLKGDLAQFENLIIRTGVPLLEDSAEGGFYAKQILRLANGQPVDLNYSPLSAAVFLIRHELTKSLAKRWA